MLPKKQRSDMMMMMLNSTEIKELVPKTETKEIKIKNCTNCNYPLNNNLNKCANCGSLYHLTLVPDEILRSILSYDVTGSVKTKTVNGKMTRYHCAWRCLRAVNRRWNQLIKMIVSKEKEVVVNIESIIGAMSYPSYDEKDLTYMRSLRLFGMHTGAERLVIEVSRKFISLAFVAFMFRIGEQLKLYENVLKIDTLVIQVKGQCASLNGLTTDRSILESALVPVFEGLKFKTLVVKFPPLMGYHLRMSIASTFIDFEKPLTFRGNVEIENVSYKSGQCEECGQHHNLLTQSKCDAYQCIEHRYICSVCLKTITQSCQDSTHKKTRLMHGRCRYSLSSEGCRQDVDWCVPRHEYPEHNDCGICVQRYLKSAYCRVHPALCVECWMPLDRKHLEIKRLNREHFANLSKYFTTFDHYGNRTLEFSKPIADEANRCVGCELTLQFGREVEEDEDEEEKTEEDDDDDDDEDDEDDYEEE